MRGWKSNFTRMAVVAAGLLGLSSQAMAAAGSTTTTVTPFAPVVTYSSTTQKTFIGYTITVANQTGNTLNHIVFEGRPSIATAFSVEGRACNPGDGPIAADGLISCPIGQLMDGASVRFTILFEAPLQSSGATSFLLSGRTVYGEGTNPTVERVEDWPAVPVGLSDNANAEDLAAIYSIPTDGGEFSLPGDKLATLISLPSSSATTAQLRRMPSGGNCNNFVICYQSEIRIVDSAGVPATFAPYLTIVLTADAANIKKGAKIGSVAIQYTDDNGVVSNVGQCASPTTPQSNGVPCIAKATQVKKKGAKGNQSNFVWELINTKNGRFTLF